MEVLRKRARITQEQLATALGITDHTYRNWIKGRTPPTMTIPQVKILCKELECSLDEIPDDFSQIAED